MTYNVSSGTLSLYTTTTVYITCMQDSKFVTAAGKVGKIGGARMHLKCVWWTDEKDSKTPAGNICNIKAKCVPCSF